MVKISQQIMTEQKQVFNPILGLSPLELELLLDQSLTQLQEFHSRTPDYRDDNPPETRGNYFWNRNFVNNCKYVAGQIPKERLLEIPQILVEFSNGDYSVSYNQQINKRIEEKLSQFTREGEEGKVSANNIFTSQFKATRKWNLEHQTEIVRYLLEAQSKYIARGDPLDLEPISQRDIASKINKHNSLVSRLIRNLTILLPDEKVIFADELVPGPKISIIKGTYALSQLQQDQDLYENGVWKVSDRELVPILRERFGIEVARRTVNKYMLVQGFGQTRIPWSTQERDLILNLARDKNYQCHKGQRKGKPNYSKISKELNRRCHHGRDIRKNNHVAYQIKSMGGR
jgi:hypothetical protein